MFVITSLILNTIIESFCNYNNYAFRTSDHERIEYFRLKRIKALVVHMKKKSISIHKFKPKYELNATNLKCEMQNFIF